jgi:riboflavin kinase/FMN adenylyltransferase
MKIFKSIDEIPFFENTGITVGTFDGVHLGHLSLIQNLNRYVQYSGGRGLVITFEPHPLAVVHPARKPAKLLTTIHEKMDQFQRNEVECVLQMPFTKELAAMDADSFVRKLLIQKIGMAGLVIGYNQKMGHEGKGNPVFLESMASRHGFFFQQVPAVKVDGQIVSSTLIRESLLRSELDLANRLLGRHYSLEGKVVQGQKIGRRLGFPTANIDIASEKLIPADGVYATWVNYADRIYKGLTNIGYSPSISGKKWGVEIYIDNFSEIIYNKRLKLEFVAFLRKERHFKSLNALIDQIEKDKEKARGILVPFVRR